MTELLDEFILIHKVVNPSYEAPRIDMAQYQIQFNFARRIMANQVDTNKWVLEVINILYIIFIFRILLSAELKSGKTVISKTYLLRF